MAQTAQGAVGDDALIQAPSLRPPDRGSIAGALASASPSLEDLVRGLITTKAPISLPRERGEPLADFAPTYSPERGLSEWGQGWGNALTIERFRHRGTINYLDDSFSSPWGELARGADGAWYPRNLRRYVRLTQSGSEWTAVTSSGTFYKFGPQAVIKTERGDYSWNLESVTTPAGRSTSLGWQSNSTGRQFLASVSYGGIGPRNHYKVDFSYEPVPVTSEYRAGIRLDLDRRVKRIVVHALNLQKKEFQVHSSTDLRYSTDSFGPAFYLAQVQHVARSGQSLPAVTYEYGSPSQALQAAKLQEAPSATAYLTARARSGVSWINPRHVTFVDSDLDGRVEFERADDFALVKEVNSEWKAETLAPARGKPNPLCRPPAAATNTPRRLMRFAPDDPDLLVLAWDRGIDSSGLLVCDREGNQLNPRVQRLQGEWREGANTKVVDLNRDLRPDMIRVGAGHYRVVENASQNGCYNFTEHPERQLRPLLQPGGTWVQDMNGDGIPDIIVRAGSQLYIWHGVGNFSFAEDAVSVPVVWDDGQPVSALSSYEITFVDANGDGMVDIVLTKGSNAYLFANDGRKFTRHFVPQLAAVDSSFGNILAEDISGSGESEFFVVRDGRAFSMQLTTPATGLLRSIEDGTGNQWLIYYTRMPASPGLRHRMSVATEVQIVTAGGGIFTHKRNFSNPVMHSQSLAFIGYTDVEVRGPKSLERYRYLNNDKVSGLVVSDHALDQSTGFDKFTENTYGPRLFQELQTNVLMSTTSGVSKGSERAVVRTDYEDFATPFCPLLTRRTTDSSTLVKRAKMSVLPVLGESIHCLAGEETLVGKHDRAELDFSTTTLFDRTENGDVQKVTIQGNGLKQTLQSLGYDAHSRLVSSFKPGQGTVRVEYLEDTPMVQRIVSPDGVITEVGARDAVTGAELAIIEVRGCTSFSRHYEYDFLERLGKTWESRDGLSADKPLRLYEYAFGNALSPGHIDEKQRISDAAFATRRDFVGGSGEVIAQASLGANGWTQGTVSVADRGALVQRELRLEDSHAGKGLPTYRQLIADASILVERTANGHGKTVEQRTMYEAGIVGVAHTEESVDSGHRSHKKFQNGILRHESCDKADGALSRHISASGATTDFVHDALGRLREVQLPDGTAHKVALDALGRVSKIQRDGFGCLLYAYDSTTGLLESVHRGDDKCRILRTTTHVRDHVGRVAQLKYKQGHEEERLSYYWDGMGPKGESVDGEQGRLTRVEGPAFSKSYYHNPDGTVRRQVTDFLGWRKLDEEFTYYSNGSVQATHRRLMDSNGQVIEDRRHEVVVDPWGNPTRILLDGNAIFTQAFDDAGHVTALSLPSGEVATFDFESRTSSLAGFHESTDFSFDSTWHHDANGDIKYEDFVLDGATCRRTSNYDDRSFLVESEGCVSAGYSYDKCGLMLEARDGLGVRDLGVSQGSLAKNGMRHDSEGRLTEKRGQKFQYGPRGQLVHWRSDDASADFQYDENESRILKSTDGVPKEAYLDNLVIMETGIYEPVRVNGIFVGSINNGIFTFWPSDRMGTSLSKSQLVVPTPFGVGDQQLRPRYSYQSGSLYDAELGLTRMGRRDYDPVLGRFTTPDEAFLGDPTLCIRSPEECNLYSYAKNSPLRYTDPHGEEAMDWADFYDRQLLGANRELDRRMSGETTGVEKAGASALRLSMNVSGWVADRVLRLGCGAAEGGWSGYLNDADRLLLAAPVLGKVAKILSSVTRAEEGAARMYFWYRYGIGEGNSYYNSAVSGTARLELTWGGEKLHRGGNVMIAIERGNFASVERPMTSLEAITGNALHPSVTSNRAKIMSEVLTHRGLQVRGIVAPIENLPGGFTQVYQWAPKNMSPWTAVTEIGYP